MRRYYKSITSNLRACHRARARRTPRRSTTSSWRFSAVQGSRSRKGEAGWNPAPGGRGVKGAGAGDPGQRLLMAVSVTLLTPLGALLGIGGFSSAGRPSSSFVGVPGVCVVQSAMAEPARRGIIVALTALVVVGVLLGLAATQPIVEQDVETSRSAPMPRRSS